MSDEIPAFHVRGDKMSVRVTGFSVDGLDAATQIQEWLSDPRQLTQVLRELCDELEKLRIADNYPVNADPEGSVRISSEIGNAVGARARINEKRMPGFSREFGLIFVRHQLQSIAVFQLFQRGAPVPTAELERGIELTSGNEEDSVFRRAMDDLSCACIRFQLWAEVTHRGSNDDRELFITTTTIARKLGKQNKHLNKTGWPAPVEKGAGSNPDKFRWNEIRPTLERQYPEKNLDEWEKHL